MRVKNIWDDPATRAIQALGYEGYTVGTISRLLRRTIGVVSYRLGRLGVSTQKIRRAETVESKKKAYAIINECKLTPRVRKAG